jgi:hypothetical protein
LRCLLAARILTVNFVVCTLAVKKIRAGFDMSDRTIPLSVSVAYDNLNGIAQSYRDCVRVEWLDFDSRQIEEG